MSNQEQRGRRMDVKVYRSLDAHERGIVFQMGLPPERIDLLTELSGVTSADVWPGRTRARLGDVEVDVIGRDAFIQNKRATGRARDLGDIEAVGQ